MGRGEAGSFGAALRQRIVGVHKFPRKLVLYSGRKASGQSFRGNRGNKALLLFFEVDISLGEGDDDAGFVKAVLDSLHNVILE